MYSSYKWDSSIHIDSVSNTFLQHQIVSIWSILLHWRSQLTNLIQERARNHQVSRPFLPSLLSFTSINASSDSHSGWLYHPHQRKRCAGLQRNSTTGGHPRPFWGSFRSRHRPATSLLPRLLGMCGVWTSEDSCSLFLPRPFVCGSVPSTLLDALSLVT